MERKAGDYSQGKDNEAVLLLESGLDIVQVIQLKWDIDKCLKKKRLIFKFICEFYRRYKVAFLLIYIVMKHFIPTITAHRNIPNLKNNLIQELGLPQKWVNCIIKLWYSSECVQQKYNYNNVHSWQYWDLKHNSFSFIVLLEKNPSTFVQNVLYVNGKWVNWQIFGDNANIFDSTGK